MPQVPESRRHLENLGIAANNHYTMEELRILAAMHQYNRGSGGGWSEEPWTREPVPAEADARREFFLQNGPQNITEVSRIIPGFADMTPDHARVILRGETLHSQPEDLPNILEGARADQASASRMAPIRYGQALINSYSDWSEERENQSNRLKEDELAGMRGTPRYGRARRLERGRLAGLPAEDEILEGAGSMDAAELGELRSYAASSGAPNAGFPFREYNAEPEIPASLGGRSWWQKLPASSVGLGAVGREGRRNDFIDDLAVREEQESARSGGRQGISRAYRDASALSEEAEVSKSLGQNHLRKLQGEK